MMNVKENKMEQTEEQILENFKNDPEYKKNE